MRSDDLQVLLPLSQLRYMMNAVETVPALSSKIATLSEQVTALRGLYLQLLETVSNKK